MTDAVISLLIQVPLVGAFIVFTLMLVREFRSDTKTRQAEMIQFIEEQNSRWRDAMKEERDARRESHERGMRDVERLAMSVHELAGSVAENTKAMVAHDAAARERYAGLERRLGDR